MSNFREKFTKWYCRRGYRMAYNSYHSGESKVVAELTFHCPFWVKPAVSLLFSPSVYYREVGYDLNNHFESGLDDSFISSADLLVDKIAEVFEDIDDESVRLENT